VGDGQGTRYSSGAAKRPVVPGSRSRSARRPRRAHRRHSEGLPPRALNHSRSLHHRRAVPHTGPRRLPWLGAVAAITGLAVLIWRCFDRVQVSGSSMAPTLQPGDRLVVWRTRSVHPGDIVAAADPRQPERTVLKRVTSVDPEGVFLLGDNPGQSTDSRQFGRVPIKSLVGKALYRYAPPARAGRLPVLNGG
jgi:nickel-type superoxide dismutase maturation protease